MGFLGLLKGFFGLLRASNSFLGSLRAKLGIQGQNWVSKAKIWPLRPKSGLRGQNQLGGMDGRTDGRMEIHPCVLQDIGPLGPLPCSHPIILKQQQSRARGTADHTRSFDDLICMFVLLMGVGCPCLPVCNNIVTPLHFLGSGPKGPMSCRKQG